MKRKLFLLACLALGASPLIATGQAPAPEAEVAALGEMQPAPLRAHVRFLASDLLAGRGPGSSGDALARAYVAAQLEAAGLEPGAPRAGWEQEVRLVGVRSRAPATLVLRRGERSLALRFRDDWVAFSGTAAPEVRVQEAEVVFVGYGIDAPEFEWDDFGNSDLRGNILLVMNNDPARDPALFAGETRLYYGRWTYKYEEAARRGAAGAIVIHTTPSAGYPWQVVQTSNTGEKFSLPASGEPQLPLKMWATEEAARRIAALGGRELDALRAAAEQRGFQPIPLGVTLSLTLANEVRSVRSANVIGRLPGTDPQLAREAVLFTAHHDHLGVKADAKPGEDAIYNGALDNASGVASLLVVARGFAALPAKPKRSIYFAALAAEEQGLLGAEVLAANPPVPAGRIAANLNFDGASIWGATRDVTLIGVEKSSLSGPAARQVARQQRVLAPDPFPDRGIFYRSDQFPFAKVGVPALFLRGGVDVIGKPTGYGKQQRLRYEATDYHQPSDELRDDWDFTAAALDTQLMFQIGLELANAPALPRWNPGDEFEAVRERAVAEAAALK